MSYIDAGLDQDVVAWDGESTSPSIPEEGEYQGAISEVAEDVSSTDKKMLVTTFEIIRNADGTDSEMAGRTCRAWYVFGTKPGKNRLMNLLNAASVEADEDGGFDTEDLLGKQIAFTFTHEVQSGGKNDDGNALPDRVFGRVTRESMLEEMPALVKGRRRQRADKTTKTAARANGEIPATVTTRPVAKAPPQIRR